MKRRVQQTSMTRVRGFTLLELLVAFTLLGLVSAVLVEAFRATTNSWRAAQRDVDETETVVLTQTFLRDRLEGLALFSVSTDAGRRAYPLEGEASEVTFSSRAPEGVESGGIFRYRLYATRGELKLGWRVDRNGVADPLAGPSWREEVLASHVQTLEIRYLERQADTGRANWIQRWYQRASAPELLSIDVTDADGNRWPQLTIAPRVDTPADCTFDPVSTSCRAE